MTRHECPTCGRDDFEREVDMKAHHKIAHNESLVDTRNITRSTRQTVLERDNKQCQRCNVKVTASDEDGADFQLHHVIPFAAGGPDHSDNLITLCNDCHNQIHQEMKNIPDDHPHLLNELRSIISDIK